MDRHTPRLTGYHTVRYPDGKIAFKIDFERGLVEIQKRNQKHYFDLVAMEKEIANSTVDKPTDI